MRTFLICCLALTAGAGLVPAYGQVIPGGGASGGQYPPGQYPGRPGPGGGGLSIPRPGKNGGKKGSAPIAPDFFADGEIVSVDEKQLVAATDDGRILTIAVTTQTVWHKEGAAAALTDLRPGMVIHIEAAEDGESFLTAMTVNVTADKKLKVRPAAPEPRPAKKGTSSSAAENDNEKVPDPGLLGQAPDDPNRPRLRRGKPSGSSGTAATGTPAEETAKTASAAKTAGSAPAKKAAATDTTEFTIEDNTEPQRLSTGTPTLVAQTMEWVNTFTNGLPNFLCQQITTRYAEASKSEGWQPVDIITAKVVYENGGETYKDISLGGKKTNKSMLELGGATSTGEFAATLRDIFSAATQATFQFSKTAQIANATVSVYRFTVELPNSHWSIKVGSQLLRPAYSGEVWINKSNSEVRKIEMQADNVPANFPMRSIYTSVAYDPVRLGTANFLLPVVAVNQACERKSSVCTKNDVEWRDYHKYSGESTISYQ